MIFIFLKKSFSEFRIETFKEMGNTPSEPEVIDHKSPDKNAYASPQKKGTSPSPKKLDKSPGFFDILSCVSSLKIFYTLSDHLLFRNQRQTWLKNNMNQ